MAVSRGNSGQRRYAITAPALLVNTSRTANTRRHDALQPAITTASRTSSSGWLLMEDTHPSTLSNTSPKVIINHITATQTVPLRHSVLWPDKPVSYVLLPEDEAGHHFGAFRVGAEDEPIAVISLFMEDVPAGSGCTEAFRSGAGTTVKAARFRKFACHPSFQGRGIGTVLLGHVLDVCNMELGCDMVWCDARVDSSAWYERRGLSRFGETFYKGEVEYVRMKIDV